jgi:putative FmdB family regulatory protein
MPVYTYHCDACGVEFEKQQSFTEDSLTRCPECRKKALRKIYHPVGITFKGSGFYATDHKSPSGQGHAHKKKSEVKETPKVPESTPKE